MTSIPSASGIYKITCTVTDKCYIGSTCNLRDRFKEHWNDLRRGVHPNQYLQHAWNKYGEQVFTFEVVELVLTPFLLEREQYWLDKLQTFAPRKGFNIARFTQAFRLGTKASPQTRERLRASHLGQPGYWTGKKRPPETVTKMSPEHRAKLSTANTGRSVSPATREKLRLANLGKKQSEETRRKAGDARKGRPRSTETKEKISLAKLGHSVSEETRAKSIASHTEVMKTLIVTSPDGVEYSVVGIRQFCKEHHLDRSTLMRVAKGEYSNHKGYKARYPEATT